MLTGTGRIILDFYGNDNVALKQRKIEKLCNEMRRKFNISIMEKEDFDDPERCVIGFACVIPANWKRKSADTMMEKICRTVDDAAFARVTLEDWELV